MRSVRRFIPVLLLVFATPATHVLHAQGAQASRGPTIARAAVGVRTAKSTPATTPPKFAETRQNKAMMIVGGAALIVGAIIGDTPGTIVMIGGAGVGLYGLYKYLE